MLPMRSPTLLVMVKVVAGAGADEAELDAEDELLEPEPEHAARPKHATSAKVKPATRVNLRSFMSFSFP